MRQQKFEMAVKTIVPGLDTIYDEIIRLRRKSLERSHFKKSYLTATIEMWRQAARNLVRNLIGASVLELNVKFSEEEMTKILVSNTALNDKEIRFLVS